MTDKPEKIGDIIKSSKEIQELEEIGRKFAEKIPAEFQIPKELEMGEHELECPHCEGTYVHFQYAKVYSSDDDYGSDVVRINSTQDTELLGEEKTPNRNRAMSIRMVFGCENCGNEFNIDYAFHKGKVYTNT